MFFSSDLLIFKRGKFNLIWLAATRGEKFISKKDLKMVDVNHACAEIMEYILRHQKIKLSLYLSSQLTFGLCVIYHKKIDKLLIDLQDLYKKSLVTFTLNTTIKPKGNKKPKDKRNDTLISILDELGEINESFGILKNLENNTKENEMDLTNQVAYLNQARFEDITLMEYDMGPSNLRNQLENDLEPMNMELLQELLGTADPNKNDIEAYLNQPFEINIEKVNEKFEENESAAHKNGKISNEIDLDRITDYYEERAPNEISSMNVINKMEVDAEINVGIANGNVTDLKENLIDPSNLIVNKSKVSMAIHEVEVDQSVIRAAGPIDLQYHRNKKDLKLPANPSRPLKRKAIRKALIVDEVTTISHQVIRENMNKKSFGLVDKNTLFPNAYVAKSLKAQIACSATNLFEFPGCYMTLNSPKLLRLWMDQKERCRNTKSMFIDYENIPKNASADNKDKQELNYSDISIEKAREASSYNMNLPVDSFTFGSDSLQKSIHQGSFDADRTLEENNPRISEIVDEVVPNYSLEKSMMPIIEEDLNPKLEINNEIPPENKLLEKGDIWRIIQNLLKTELNNNKNWNEVRIAFTDICPKRSTKKTAAMVFLTLLRLGKYGKIQLFQEASHTEIFIGLPTREI